MFAVECLYISHDTNGDDFGKDLYINYEIKSFTTEGRDFPVKSMGEYPYYRQIKDIFNERVASINEGSHKREEIIVEVHMISDIEKPSNYWVEASTVTLYILPMWLTHKIQVRYIFKQNGEVKEATYDMGYRIVYSLLFAPASLLGSFSDRFSNYSASRIADSIDLFLHDYEKNRKNRLR